MLFEAFFMEDNVKKVKDNKKRPRPSQETENESLRKIFELRNSFLIDDMFTAIVKTACHIELHLEYYMSSCMEKPEVYYPEDFGSDRDTLSNQLRLAEALGMIPKSLSSALKDMAGLRNRYGHNLHYEIEEFEVQAVMDKHIGKLKADPGRFQYCVDELDRRLSAKDLHGRPLKVFQKYFEFAYTTLSYLIICGREFANEQMLLRKLKAREMNKNVD